MGMAASQARLLTITARIHDVEYQAQSIQNAKVQLATQSDEVYQEYLNALDATTLTIKDYEGNIITANFNNLWGRSAVDTANSYALFDSKGRLIVSEDEKEAYDAYKNAGGNDPYEFAIYMLDGGQSVGEPGGNLEERVATAEATVGENYLSSDSNLSKYKANMDELLAEFVTTSGASPDDILDADCMQTFIAGSDLDDKTLSNLKEIMQNYESAELTYKNRLYQNYGEEVYNAANGDPAYYDEEDFNYYVDLYKKIESAGGNCVSIEDYNEGNANSDAANDSEWLKNMIECGKITVDIIKKDNKTGEFSYSATSPSSDTYLGYTTTTTIDKSALAKAEAEYEHATKEIDQKDKKYDMDLSKLETERTALTTEYESVKKVISDNIERTFGIFS